MPPRVEKVAEKHPNTSIGASPSFVKVDPSEQEPSGTRSRSKGKQKEALDAGGNEVVIVGDPKHGTDLPLALLRSVYLSEPYGFDGASGDSSRHPSQLPASSRSDPDWSKAVSGSANARTVSYRPVSSFVRFRFLSLDSSSAVSHVFSSTQPPVRLLKPFERKRILVTGGGGFVGSHLVDRLLFLGHDVTVIDNFFSGCAVMCLPTSYFVPY
jgi:UDP-glucuronate decarboxylase